MKRSTLPLLDCPNCAPSLHPLYIAQETSANPEYISEGVIGCSLCGAGYPIESGIARLMPSSLLEPQKSEMKARDAQVSQYDSNLFLNIFGRFEIPLTLDMLGPQKTDKLLEAGCGTGRMTNILSSKVGELVSVDFSFSSLLANKKKLDAAEVKNVELIQADLCHLPFADSVFDRALSCQVIEHIPGDDARLKAVRSIGRVVTDNASVVVSGYQYQAIIGIKEGCHDGGIPFFRFTKPEFTDLLSSEFKIEKVTGKLGYVYIAKCTEIKSSHSVKNTRESAFNG